MSKKVDNGSPHPVGIAVTIMALVFIIFVAVLLALLVSNILNVGVISLWLMK
jgi:hypothetical protein